MKKNLTTLLTVATAAALMMTGCGQSTTTQTTAAAETETEAQAEETEAEEEESEEAAEEETTEEEATEEAEVPEAEIIPLEVGEMQVYDFGDYKLHAYITNDAITDVCYIIETETNLIGIESPSFFDNLEEYADYIEQLGKPMEDLVLPYHPVGGEGLVVVNTYGTQRTLDLLEEGGDNQVMIAGFAEAFGESFDATVHEITNVIEPGTQQIGGLEMEITETNDGFDILLPDINCAFIHMMGSDVHNMLTSVDQIDEMIDQLKGYQEQGIALILTSHYAPEGMDAVEEKIAYLETTKELAEECADSAEFIEAMKEAFPDYSGESFMEGTAAALFPEQ